MFFLAAPVCLTGDSDNDGAELTSSLIFLFVFALWVDDS
jgi:hypothetical protein